MGQNSSQLVTLEEQAVPPESRPQSKKRKTKKSKRKSAGSSGYTEEDSARALMQMREEDLDDNVRGHSENYDLASGPSMSEKNSPDTFEHADKPKKRKLSSHSEKVGRKRRRSHGSFDPQYAGNLYSHSENGNVELPVTSELGESYQWLENWVSWDGNADLICEEVDDVPAATLGEIPSDDEDIAAFLRGFQEQEEDTSARPLDTLDQLEEEHDDVLASTMPSTSPISHAKKKKKLAEVSDLVRLSSISSVSNEIGYQQLEESHAFPQSSKDEQADFGLQQPRTDYNAEGNNNFLDGTGQHTLASDSNIDFEAFDKYCAAYGLGTANVFNDPSGQSPPVKPELMADCTEPIRAQQDTVADSEDGSAPRRKHKRRVSRSVKQKTACAEDPLVSNSLSNDGLYLLNDEQSDQVLPGLEDMQYSSKEYHNLVTQLGSPAPSTYSDGFGEPINAPLDAKGNGGKSRGPNSRTGQKTQITSPEAEVEEEQARREGKFTSAEISRLENFRDSYCAERDITTWQFNDMIHSVVRESPKAKEMWQEAYEVIPYRKKVTIQRFCRRRFHNFETRGSWTEEDDKALARAVEEKGKSWKAIGQIMERHPEDVRDRWRNYHVNAENRNKEQWTDIEITNLAMAVHDCMQIMKDAKRSAKLQKYEGRDVPESESDSDEEAADARLINWQVVSDRMQGTRSRLQCSFKWGKLKEEARIQALRQVQAPQQDLGAVDQEQRPAKQLSWRQKLAQKRVMEMRPGDIYDFLHAISSCKAAQEGNIPWKSLGDDDFRKRWTTVDRKAAWAMFRDSVLGAEGYHYQDIVNLLLNNLLANAGARLEERWDPEVHGYGQAPPPKTTIRTAGEMKKKRQEKLQKAKDKRKAKAAKRGSNEYVYRNKVKSSVFVAATDDEEGTSDTGKERDPVSISRSSNESRRSSDVSEVPAARRLTTGQETANTTVDESSEENSVTQRFNNELASQLQRSLA
ncbi:MAG: hypothetical protein Q9195_000293 [Heterodermia aff. obscurata]